MLTGGQQISKYSKYVFLPSTEHPLNQLLQRKLAELPVHWSWPDPEDTKGTSEVAGK